MWKAVGTVNQNDNKKNRSKDEVNCQPFAQASRLRLNESQLSGHQSNPFMNEYFRKRKSSDSTLQRVLSQKNIQVRQSTSPSASLRQIQSPRNINKKEQILGGVSIQTDSLVQIQQKETCQQKKVQSDKGKVEQKYEKIGDQLRKVKEEQLKITKFISQEIEEFRCELKQIEKEIAKKMEMQNQKNTRQNINPQLLAKIKQEGARFNQKMKDLDLRKEQIKERYKEKFRKE